MRMLHEIGLCLVLLMVASLAAAGEKVPDGPPIVIHCGRLIDGLGGPGRNDAVVVIRGDRIEAVGSAGELSPPRDAIEIDLRDATLLPGLIDVHSHILLDSGYGQDDFLRRSSAENAIRGLVNAQQNLRAGFTTIRDPGDLDPHYAHFAVRDAISRGAVEGPRIFAAGHFLTITGGHADRNDAAPELSVPTFGRLANGSDEIRIAVREEAKRGADWIKLNATGGIYSAGDAPALQEFSFEEMAVAVAEARRLTRHVAAHSHGVEGTKAALRAGARSIEHGSMLDKEAVQLFKKHGAYLVPTIYATQRTLSEGEAGKTPQYALEKARRVHAMKRASFERALDADVRIAYGTDAGALVPHGENARQFAVMVEWGMTPGDAIRSATSVAAALLGVQDEIGSVEAGKFADLVAVRGDPLADVSELERIGFVMKSGRVYRDDLGGGSPGMTH